MEAVAMDITVDHSGAAPLIPPGRYQATLIYWETRVYLTAPKVYLWFRLQEPGEHLGKEIYRPYSVKELIGKPGRNGKFRLGHRQDMYKTLCRVLDHVSRPDRISLRELQRKVLLISVRTVVKDYKGRALPRASQYSVVDDVIDVETGAER
jgi:hypothetical protein